MKVASVSRLGSDKYWSLPPPPTGRKFESAVARDACKATMSIQVERFYSAPSIQSVLEMQC